MTNRTTIPVSLELREFIHKHREPWMTIDDFLRYRLDIEQSDSGAKREDSRQHIRAITRENGYNISTIPPGEERTYHLPKQWGQDRAKQTEGIRRSVRRCTRDHGRDYELDWQSDGNLIVRRVK